MSVRNFERGPDTFRRRGPTQKPRKTFLIVTEGKKTEPSYFDALKRRLLLSNVEVRVHHPEATDPKSLTDEAIRLDKQRRREAKQDHGVAYDEVWVVYDLEKPHDERRRLHRGQQSRQNAHGISVAVSDPSFEFWLLLHFEFTTRPFSDCQAVIRRLKKHLPEYEKTWMVSADLLERTTEAIKYAGKCRQHHQACNGSGNPSTDVDLLVQNLNAVAAAAYQFPLPARR
jgi:hypothetical protein